VRRRLEFLVPALVLLGFLAAAVGVNLLLTSAEERGVDALEESLRSEVRAVARRQDQRITASLEGSRESLAGLPRFDLQIGSATDEAFFNGPIGRLISSGLYLVDDAGTITVGNPLVEPGAVGSRFEWPGYPTTGGAPRSELVLPVSDGYAGAGPVYALVYPLVGGPELDRHGVIVSEVAVSADSDFNKEISALSRGDTGQYYFFDSTGVVLASNDSDAIGQPVGDERLTSEEEGIHRFDDQIAVLAEVPVAGWRVAFRQDTHEFQQALTGPLQTTGRVLVLALLAAGLLLMGMLYRRLATARAEQERLRELSESQQEFISIVSHELRTPVAGVLGFLETTLDHWEAMDDGERRNAVGRAASNARRLQAMTRDVLDTQSVEAGRLMYVFERLDLAAEVQVAVDAARDQDAERSIDVHLPNGPVWVSGDPDRLQQVLANLIDNARRNSPAVVPVDVRLAAGDGEARVTVSDHGAGIAEESLERIFDKFVRGRGESVSGTGLGLYISRQIVDAHRGRVWAESPPGEGAVFRFVLPLAAAETAPETASADVSTD
jgi:signal transduction histidine kinase/type II secretory pathway pseudopilin PulG